MSDQLPDGVTGTWLHSFEEDQGDVLVYRPPDHDFPLARGRDGIEFAADGSFVEWAIGRGDARQAVPGRWQTADTGNVVEVSTARDGDLLLEILRVTPDRLELRRRADR
jgi:hypothetical protein